MDKILWSVKKLNVKVVYFVTHFLESEETGRNVFDVIKNAKRLVRI